MTSCATWARDPLARRWCQRVSGSGLGSWPASPGGWEQALSGRAAARSRAGPRLIQAQGIGQGDDGGAVGRATETPLQGADGLHAHPRPLGQVLLGQGGGAPPPSQQQPKGRGVDYRHLRSPSVQRVQSSEFRVQGSRFRVRSSKFRVRSSEFRVQGSRFKVQRSKRVPAGKAPCIFGSRSQGRTRSRSSPWSVRTGRVSLAARVPVTSSAGGPTGHSTDFPWARRAAGGRLDLSFLKGAAHCQ